mmetsp:Transcript_56784/g.172884  ORF Transcript_56784/g.172884 Transcript_56784/m.172884 type:complete len:293 (-) Transcript_56784:480-1358(-)
MAAGVHYNLRRHPGHGTRGGKTLGVLGALGTAEVRELHPHVQRHEQIGALDVPVHDRRVAAVEVLQTVQAVARRALELLARERAEIAEHTCHRTARHVLQEYRQLGPFVRVAQATHDVWVRELAANLQLGLQHLNILVVRAAARVDDRLLQGEDLAGAADHCFVHAAVGPASDALAFPPRAADALELGEREALPRPAGPQRRWRPLGSLVAPSSRWLRSLARRARRRRRRWNQRQCRRRQRHGRHGRHRRRCGRPGRRGGAARRAPKDGQGGGLRLFRGVDAPYRSCGRRRT